MKGKQFFGDYGVSNVPQNAYSLSYLGWGGAFPVGLLNPNHINIEHLSN